MLDRQVKGASFQDRASRESSQSSLSRPKATIPCADDLVRLMASWSSLPASKFHAAYPFFAGDRQRVIADYDLCADDRATLEATALLFAEYADDIEAQAIEARRAETGTGSMRSTRATVPKASARPRMTNPTTPAKAEERTWAFDLMRRINGEQVPARSPSTMTEERDTLTDSGADVERVEIMRLRATLEWMRSDQFDSREMSARIAAALRSTPNDRSDQP